MISETINPLSNDKNASDYARFIDLDYLVLLFVIFQNKNDLELKLSTRMSWSVHMKSCYLETFINDIYI